MWKVSSLALGILFSSSVLAESCVQQFTGLWKSVVSEKDDNGRVIDYFYTEVIADYKKDGSFKSIVTFNPVNGNETSRRMVTTGDWRCENKLQYVNIKTINGNPIQSTPNYSTATFYDITDTGKNLIAAYDKIQNRTYTYIKIKGSFEQYLKTGSN